MLLQPVEVPIPIPIRNEVLVKLEAASLNPVDWKIQKGQLRPLFPLNFPFIPRNAALPDILLCSKYLEIMPEPRYNFLLSC